MRPQHNFARTSAEFISKISAPTISIPFDFCYVVKGKLKRIVLCPIIVQITILCMHACMIRWRIDGEV